MSKKQVVDEIHKPARKNFKRRKTIVKGLNDLFQADLIELIPFHRFNNGSKYILIVIDCFSKFVWAKPTKSKTGKDITAKMEEILNQSVPKNLQVDQGKEFWNVSFQNLCKKFKVNLYSTYSPIKASMAERVIRTIKGKLYRQFSLRGKYKWIDILDEVVETYNHTPHSAIGFIKPAEINSKNEKSILIQYFSKTKVAARNKFNVGDIVRISKYKGVFAKGYTSNWSTELFQIVKVKISDPVTYLLEDMNKKPILGAFYEKELQLTQQPDVYLIEKILKRKGNKMFVKWLGLSTEHNSWINRIELI